VGQPPRAPHRGERRVAGGGRPGRRAVPGGKPPGAGPLAPPVRPPARPPPRGSRPEAVLAPVALVHPHAPPLRRDVGDLPRGARGQEQPTGVDPRHTPPGVRGLDHGQEGPALPPPPHDGPCGAVPGAPAGDDGPRALPRARGETPAPLAVQTAGPLRALRVVAQEAAGLVALVGTDLVRSAPVVWRQRLHRCDVTRVGPGSQAPALQVSTQAASERRQRPPPGRGAHPRSPQVATHQDDR
jgi:hypothetical protein